MERSESPVDGGGAGSKDWDSKLLVVMEIDLREAENEVEEEEHDVDIVPEKAAVARLPLEVREQILYLTEPEAFTSLVLTSRAWREAAETPHLWASKLSRCPSFSVGTNFPAGPFPDESLALLKKQFMQEAKRNLFEAYLRPKRTTINLISNTTSSAAAFPGGEALEFSISPRGLWCLAFSSSRIFVVDLASTPVRVTRELKVLRRPLSAKILDDGRTMAVLSTDHTVNIYDLAESRPRLARSLALDHPPHAITLSPKGEVLALAYEGGVEVYSLAPQALATDSRSVKCDRVDHLCFSIDGTMLLGTTQTSRSPSTVILSAPYFSDADYDMPHAEMISHMWTSQILFPNSSRDCSHATLLPQPNGEDVGWALTYDRVFESFRAVRTGDLRNGTTYFTGPKPARPAKSDFVPCTLPTSTQNGDLVAAGFLGSEIWLYGVPNGLDDPRSIGPDYSSNGRTESSGTSPPSLSTEHSSDTSANVPRWQVLVDKYRNVFSKGQRIAVVPGITSISWVNREDGSHGAHNIAGRLVMTAPGGVSKPVDLEAEDHASLDGGRLVILDFDMSLCNGTTEETTVELGDVEPQLLEEEDTDMATEIAIVRRRTVARRDGATRPGVSDGIAPVPAVPVTPLDRTAGFGLDSTHPEPATAMPATPSSTEGFSLEEAAHALDGPYSHTQPRSSNTLARSATAVAASRRRNPPLPASGHVEFRRSDGTELPHESDADHWVPPPPPYTADADEPLPEHLQAQIQPRAMSMAFPPRRLVRSQTAREGTFRRRSTADADSPHSTRRPHWTRQGEPEGYDRSLAASPILRSSSSSIRRPSSSYEPRSHALRIAQPALPVIATIAEPMSPLAEQAPIFRLRSSSISSTASDSSRPSSSHLEGATYPPFHPPAAGLDGAVTSEESITTFRVPDPAIMESFPPNTSSVHDLDSSTIPIPTAGQLHHLHQRHSQTFPSTATIRHQTYVPFATTFPDGPPAAAVGAAGRPPQRSRSRFRSPFRRPVDLASQTTDAPPVPRSRLYRASRMVSSPNLRHSRRLDTIPSVDSPPTFGRPETRAGESDLSWRGRRPSELQGADEMDVPEWRAERGRECLDVTRRGMWSSSAASKKERRCVVM